MIAVIEYKPGTGYQTEAIEAVQEIAKKVNGRKRNRKLYFSDIEDLFDSIDKCPDAKAIRSYSRDGFVPNAYKWPAEIVFCQATKNDNGSYDIIVSTTDAKRSHGSGALITIDGRAI